MRIHIFFSQLFHWLILAGGSLFLIGLSMVSWTSTMASHDKGEIYKLIGFNLVAVNSLFGLAVTTIISLINRIKSREYYTRIPKC